MHETAGSRLYPHANLNFMDGCNRLIARRLLATREEIARDKSDAENIGMGFLTAAALTVFIWFAYYVFNDKYGLGAAVFDIAMSLSVLAYVGIFAVPLVHVVSTRWREGKTILPSISNLLK